MRTHIVKKNPHPVFDELFEFSNLDPSGENNYSLRLTVLTYDTFTRDEILGEVLFEIENLDEFQSAESIFTRDMTPRRLQVSHVQQRFFQENKLDEFFFFSNSFSWQINHLANC